MNSVTKELYIIGAGGFGREAADTVREINRADASANGPVYRIAGFVDDDESLWGTIVNDIEVKGGVEWLCGLESGDGRGCRHCAVIAVANPQMKRAIAHKLEGLIEWATIIHPTAVISPYAEIGAGAIIQANACIGPNARIGKQCCVNFCSGVGHDAVLGDCVSVMSHCDITGYDVLKDGVYVATSVSIIPSVTVGENAFVGAGSVVVKDVPEDIKVFGCPARRME
jgi:sugar O-acyltransferase (sialic acid O-acetyltransferase NeuD family)